MSHRRPVLELLARYAHRCPDETEVVERIRALVESHFDCLLRTCPPGHVTASAWILSSDHRRCLLTRHRKLGRWLQLGGHVDGEPHIERAALREAREESGMEHFELFAPSGVVEPLDLDVHAIPAHGAEPAHEHHDVRFLLIAAPGQEPVRSEESDAVEWVEVEELAAFTDEESVLRLQRKARRVLDGRTWSGARPR